MVELINVSSLKALGRSLTDVKAILIQGTWEKQTYKQTATTQGYSDHYFCATP
ncbi:MAG: hypothetical protein AAGE59_25155 [Cyanobacteria bacterium P01_F01_bin.86]